MTAGRSYVETLDQAALAASFDLLQARTAPSFDKFFRDVVAIVEYSPAEVTPQGDSPG